jgi:hypothetical protein
LVVAGVAVFVVLVAVPAAAQQAASPLQGFSIVLVQGDMAASDGRSNLPEAAARAVGDMKGFLPFRSYHLVDSAWILADSVSGLINAKLRGPDGVDYDVVLEALPASGGGQRVAFRLRESGGEASQQTRAMERDLATLNAIVASLRDKYEAAVHSQTEKGGGGSTRELRSTEFLRTQLADAERRVAELTHRLAAVRDDRSSVPARGSFAARSTVPAGATLIETMFTMRLGETVVVGTSRTGVDKALVAVLTAVPQSKGRGGF